MPVAYLLLQDSSTVHDEICALLGAGALFGALVSCP